MVQWMARPFLFLFVILWWVLFAKRLERRLQKIFLQSVYFTSVWDVYLMQVINYMVSGLAKTHSKLPRSFPKIQLFECCRPHTGGAEWNTNKNGTFDPGEQMENTLWKVVPPRFTLQSRRSLCQQQGFKVIMCFVLFGRTVLFAEIMKWYWYGSGNREIQEVEMDSRS